MLQKMWQHRFMETILRGINMKKKVSDMEKRIALMFAITWFIMILMFYALAKGTGFLS